MLQKLINNYETFGDGLITEFQYNSNYEYLSNKPQKADEIEVYMSCFNKNRNFERDLIKLVCRDIVHFNFHKFGGMIHQALIKNESGIITMDFFPDLFSDPSGSGLIGKENLTSDCIIKCKDVEYEILG